MTDYNKLQKFLTRGFGFPFKDEDKSFSILTNKLGPTREISEEIKDMLFKVGGKWFKLNVRLIIGENPSEPLHFMGNPLYNSQNNLIDYLRNNPETVVLPIIKLNNGEVWVGIDPADESNFGKVHIQINSGIKYFSDLDDLFDHFKLIE